MIAATSTWSTAPTPACNKLHAIRSREHTMIHVMTCSRRALTGAALAAATALLVAPAAAQTRKEAPKIGDPPEAMNMRLVGSNDLQGRTAYQPTIAKQGNRYIAYIGHH